MFQLRNPAADVPRFLLLLATALSLAIAAYAADSNEPAPESLLEPPAESADPIRDMQAAAVETGAAPWGHWGPTPEKYSSWTSHSSRLIPLYTFGISLKSVAGENSVYRDAERLTALYGRLPDATLNEHAEYFDQTDVYRLQLEAANAGKKRIILFVFDGMDWQTTQAAAIYNSGKSYSEGRGAGLSFLDYRGVETDFGFFVTSPHNSGTKVDVDAQVVRNPGGQKRGGYDVTRGGATPWATSTDPTYLIGRSREIPHPYTDSAASATSLTSGVKTYNDSVNVDWEGNQVRPISHELQDRGFSIGVTTSVPISHATPSAAYANNVTRADYQDLTRDLLGLRSIAHRAKPLPGVDVLLGCGWGETREENSSQGQNFVPGNIFLTDEDLHAVDAENGGRYVVVQRTAGVNGKQALDDAARQAIDRDLRLFGFFGVAGGHLPFRTADGRYDPTVSITKAKEKYSPEDIDENPTLADMAVAALEVLSKNEKGFWLMVEAGDVDWANHANNIDNSIGAVLSGAAAFEAVTRWIESHGGWDETVVLVTSDHGHYLFLNDLEAIASARKTPSDDQTVRTARP